MKQMLWAAAAVAIVGAAPVGAQQQPSATPSTPPSATAPSTTVPSTTPPSAAAPSTSSQQQSGSTTPSGPSRADSEKLIGKDVYGSDGKKIGEIENVLISTDGQAKAAVISVGGFLGLGAKDVAITWSDLNVSGDRATTTMTEDQLKSAPEWEKNKPDPRFSDAKPLK